MTLEQEKALAFGARVDPRTLRKFLAGTEVRRDARERIEAAAKGLGYPLPRKRRR